MFPLIYGLVLFFSSQGWLVHSSPAKYDQRQEGDINVQIDLKDVKVLALLKSDIFDDYTNYDYAYDYADFTLKPIVKPTTKPPETTTSVQSSESSATSSSTMNIKTTKSAFSTTIANTINDNQSIENSTMLSGSTILEETTLITLNVDENFENTSTEITKVDEEVANSTTETLLEKPILHNQRQIRRCRKGFDKSGRCYRRRISILPRLAMNIAPEFVRSVRKRISI